MNETLKNLRDRLTSFWNQWDPRRRRNILISLSLLLVCFVVVLWVVLRPNYVTVMGGLDAQSLGDAETQLSTLKIPYKLQGSSILVPNKDADQARIQLAEAGIPKSGYIGYSSVSNSFGMTQDQFNIQVLDALQQSLNETIQSINGVEEAQVHIVMPPQQLFVSNTDQTPAKASVFVQLGTGVQLSSSQVAGIQQLVAHSVTGLSTDNVSVVDQNGDTLSQSADAASTTTGSANSELAIRNQLEQQMTDQLTAGLAKIVGDGNAVVSVQANVTFNQSESTTNNVLPAPNQSTGLVQSETTSRSTTNSGGTTGGAAGQSSTNPNLSSYAGNSTGNGGATSSTTNQTITYDNGSQTIKTVSDPMQLNGYRVSVFLNAQDKALNAKTVSQIRQFVSNSIGATSGSTNTANAVSVTTVPFQTQALFAQSNSHGKWTLWGSIGAGVLALAGLLLWLRSRKGSSAEEGVMGQVVPIQEIPEQPLEQNVNEDEQMRRQLAKLANQKPEEFANLVRTWLVSD